MTQVDNVALILSKIEAGLNSSIFGYSYEFWALIIALLNFIMLAITLWFLIRSTIASEQSAAASVKMAQETVMQRLLKSAKDVYFDMGRQYFEEHPDKAVFGFLTTRNEENAPSQFTFVASRGYSPIGRAASFVKIENDLRASYFMEENGVRRNFLEELKKNAGFIKAKVVSPSGTEFIYTYKAITDNWKKELLPPESTEQFPPVNDTFVLVVKDVDQDYFQRKFGANLK